MNADPRRSGFNPTGYDGSAVVIVGMNADPRRSGFNPTIDADIPVGMNADLHCSIDTSRL